MTVSFFEDSQSMVVPTNNMSNHPKREEVMKLMAEKDKIEAELRELHAVLTAVIYTFIILRLNINFKF